MTKLDHSIAKKANILPRVASTPNKLAAGAIRNHPECPSHKKSPPRLARFMMIVFLWHGASSFHMT